MLVSATSRGTRRLRGGGGFTLIEAVVALAVLSIGILTINIMQNGAVQGNYRASQITTASSRAGDRMEKINGMAFDDNLLSDRNGNGTDQDADGNGIDDDDEGTGTDTIANFGLDETNDADHTFTFAEDGLTMHYNIAVDQPLDNMKTIRVIIVRDADRQQLVFDYYKAGPM